MYIAQSLPWVYTSISITRVNPNFVMRSTLLDGEVHEMYSLFSSAVVATLVNDRKETLTENRVLSYYHIKRSRGKRNKNSSRCWACSSEEARDLQLQRG